MDFVFVNLGDRRTFDCDCDCDCDCGCFVSFLCSLLPTASDVCKMKGDNNCDLRWVIRTMCDDVGTLWAVDCGLLVLVLDRRLSLPFVNLKNRTD